MDWTDESGASGTEAFVDMDVSEDDAVDGAALDSSTDDFVSFFKLSVGFLEVGVVAVALDCADDGITLVTDSVRL